MKVFSVVGITQSGKTTTIENIINELRKRGYSIGSVKEIHFEQFAIDTEGTNTYRHKQAGSKLVTARGNRETDILFQEKLDIDKILSFYDHDYVVLEGVTDANVPKIITAHNEKDLEGRLDDMVFAISGRISNTISELNRIPVISSIDSVEQLVDLIEAKVYNRLLDFPDECCSEFNLQIDGQDIDIEPFVQDELCNAIIKILKDLRVYDKGKEINIKILKQ